jgi:hypothetical protein
MIDAGTIDVGTGMIIFWSTLTVIVWSFYFWLKSKRGQRWLDKR